jgi:hypothetical protein
MNHITCHVAQILSNKGQEHYWKFMLISRWNEIMGNMACKVCIFKITGNTVVLGVYDSNWMQELHLLSELIKEKINTVLGSTCITQIKLKYMVKSDKRVQKKEKNISLAIPKRSLTPRESQALLQITDQELAEALVGFLQKCHQFS